MAPFSYPHPSPSNPQPPSLLTLFNCFLRALTWLQGSAPSCVIRSWLSRDPSFLIGLGFLIFFWPALSWLVSLLWFRLSLGWCAGISIFQLPLGGHRLALTLVFFLQLTLLSRFGATLRLDLALLITLTGRFGATLRLDLDLISPFLVDSVSTLLVDLVLPSDLISPFLVDLVLPSDLISPFLVDLVPPSDLISPFLVDLVSPLDLVLPSDLISPFLVDLVSPFVEEGLLETFSLDAVAFSSPSLSPSSEGVGERGRLELDLAPLELFPFEFPRPRPRPLPRPLPLPFPRRLPFFSGSRSPSSSSAWASLLAWVRWLAGEMGLSQAARTSVGRGLISSSAVATWRDFNRHDSWSNLDQTGDSN